MGRGQRSGEGRGVRWGVGVAEGGVAGDGGGA